MRAVCPVKNANYSFPSDVLPSGIATYPVDFSGVPQLTTVVNTNETANLTPGRYWNYTCRINGKLKLTSGIYYFHVLHMENNSIIECDVTFGPVKIFISDFYYSGATCNIIGGDASRVFYGYSGTNTADVDKLKGTLIAPNATINAGGWSKTFMVNLLVRKLSYIQIVNCILHLFVNNNITLQVI